MKELYGLFVRMEKDKDDDEEDQPADEKVEEVERAK